MTRIARHRTLGAFLAWSGLMSYLISSPCYGQISPPDAASPTSTPSSSPSGGGDPVAAAVNYSGTNVIDFGNHTGGTLTLTGDLVNSGTLYAISTNPAITTAVFSAPNVFNQTGATISTVLPAGGLPGYANAISGLSLIFNVTNNFVNSGTINSAGALAINAGGSITNALPQGITAPLPVMQAINNIDIASQIGNIVNAGTIASVAGNINLTAAAANVLSVNNIGGIMQALQGNINVRDALFTGTVGMNIVGGDWLSKNLNLMNGNGLVSAQFGSATGVINAIGSGAEIGVNTGDLILGNIKIDGDPTYYSADGDVYLPASISTSGFDLAVIAKNNILATTGTVAIDTRGGAGLGVDSGNVLMVAGAKFVTPLSGTDGPPGSNGVSVTWTSPDALTDDGGSININTLTIDTGGDLSLANAGNVTLVAYQGKNSDTGQIITDMASSYISAKNYAPGFSGGNVTLIAGATSGAPSSIVFGNITGGGGSASIGVYAATPVITGASTAITVIDGTPQAGSGTYTAGNLQNARIDLGVLNNDGAPGIDAPPGVAPIAGSNGGAITVSSAGDVFVNSLLSRGGQGGNSGFGIGSTGADGGNGGVISVSGGDNVLAVGTIIDASGGKGGNGGVRFGVAYGGGKGGNAGSFIGTATENLTVDAVTLNGGEGGGPLGFLVCCGGTSYNNSGGEGGTVVLNAPEVFTGTSAIQLNGGNGGLGFSVGSGAGNGGAGGSGGKFTANADNFQGGSGDLQAKGGLGGVGGQSLNGGLPSKSGSGGNGGSVQIIATQQITIGNVDTTGGDGATGADQVSSVPASAGGNGAAAGKITLQAGAGLFTGDLIAKGGAGGPGGNGIAFGLSANPPGAGGNGGQGGVITLSGTACCVGSLDVTGGAGGAAGADLGGKGKAANGGNGAAGGSISITSADDIFVSFRALADSGIGGLGVNGGLDGSGGNGGTIDMTANGTTLPLTLGDVVSAKGIGAGNKGGTITLTSAFSVETISGAITAEGQDGAAGGSITINAPNLSLNGFDSLSGMSLDASSTASSGGTITVNLSSTSSCACSPDLIAGGVNASGSGAGNKGGSISLTAKGALEVGGVIYAQGMDGATGGSVNVSGNELALLGSDSDTGASVDASSTDATGGSVTIASTGKALPATFVSGAVLATGSGAGNKGGTITLTANTGLEVDGLVSVMGDNGASGGAITVNAKEFAFLATDTTLDASSTQAAGGTISMSATSGIFPSIIGGTVNVSGSGKGNKAGSFSVTSSNSLFIDGPVNAVGQSEADGGTISINAVEVSLIGVDPLTGRTLDASSTDANGGVVTLITTGPDVLSNSGCGCNSIFGSIAANGANNGGRINLGATGGFSFESPLSITADGNLGSGGLIQFTSPGSATLNLHNSANISATNLANNSGRIGINVGPTGGVNIDGGGVMLAGEYVGIGDLDPVTLAVVNPSEVQLSDFPIRNYTFTMGSVGNKILISQPLPPTPTTTKTLTKTLTGGVSLQVEIPLNLPQIPSNSTITNIDQTAFYVSLPDVRLIGGNTHPNSFLDGVLVSSPGDALNAKGINASTNAEGGLVLGKGNLLVLPGATVDGGMQIATNEGTLFVAPGSIAFLIETGNDVAVYALHEGKAGDISFKSGNQTIELSTGQQAVFTRGHADFSKVNPGALIPARKVNSYKMDNGVTAFVAEYSLPVALSTIRPLKAMRSSDDLALRRLSGTVQKNAAILSLIGTRYGPYKQQQHASP